MTYKEKKQSWKRAMIGMLAVGITLGSMHTAYSYQQENAQLQQDISAAQTEVNSRDKQIEGQKKELEALKNEKEVLEGELNKQKREEAEAARAINVRVTAYDLSVESCGRPVGSSGYGITASGVSLAGQSLWSARAIAVDPSVIPLGSKVQLSFENPAMQQYNGVYTAVDTGGAIVGNKIDLFMGDYGNNAEADEVMSFGVQNAKAVVL